MTKKTISRNAGDNKYLHKDFHGALSVGIDYVHRNYGASELFKFLESRGGREAVEDFWNYLSDEFLGNLRTEVEQHGLRGCWLYWNHTLNEEAADFTMELDETAGRFKIVMHHCPSMGKLLENKHIEPYHDYCRHCDVLYRRVLEPLGYEFKIDLSDCRRARCAVIINSCAGDIKP